MTALEVIRGICPHCGALLEVTLSEVTLSEAATLLAEETAAASPDQRYRCGACDCDFTIPSRDEFRAQAHSRWPVIGIAKVDSASFTLDRILFPAISLLKSHWLPLVSVSSIVNVIWFAVIGWPMKVLWNSWQRILSDESSDWVSFAVVLGGTLAVGFLAAPISAYTMTAMVRLSLRIARYGGRDRITIGSAMADLRVPMMVIVRVSLLLIAVGMVLSAILVAGLLMTVVLSLATDPESASLIGTLGMGTALLGFVFLAQWLVWPGIFVVADERGTFATGFMGGIRIARQYRSLSLSLVTIYFLMATLGSLLFYVGQIFTTPLAMLPMAIGYLRFTGGQNYGQPELLNS